MAGQVHFYVNRVHAIGGVTTWSFQAASFLSSRYAARVLTLSQGESEPPDAPLFPEQAVRIWAPPKGGAAGGAHPKTPREVKPRKESLPTRPTREAKPAKTSWQPLHPADPLDGTAEEALRQAAL